MNLNITWATAAKVTNGELVKGSPDRPFNTFSIDTRVLKISDTFWAVKGYNFDGHDFLKESLGLGVEGWVIRRDKLPSGTAMPENVLVVEDTLKALLDIASYHRDRWQIPVACVTGSNGKSTTKEMIASIFSQAGPTCKNKGNLNNQFGFPLSALELGLQHRLAVFELGASRKGDILEIGKAAKPDIGVITNISAAHLEFFGDIETVYKTKTELLECIKPGGTLVYNADDTLLQRLHREWTGKKITFGFSPDADVRIAEGEDFALTYQDKTRKMKPPAPQRHNRYNAAAAAATAMAAQLGWDKVECGFLLFKPLAMRMQTETAGDAKIIIDAYNANPASMRAVISSFAESETKKPLVAVLGDMKELGKESEKLHSELGSWIAGLPLDKIFVAGPEAKALAEGLAQAGAGEKTVYAPGFQDWLPELKQLAQQGGTFLIKASRSMEFEKISSELLNK